MLKWRILQLSHARSSCFFDFFFCLHNIREICCLTRQEFVPMPTPSWSLTVMRIPVYLGGMTPLQASCSPQNTKVYDVNSVADFGPGCVGGSVRWFDMWCIWCHVPPWSNSLTFANILEPSTQGHLILYQDISGCSSFRTCHNSLRAHTSDTSSFPCTSTRYLRAF